MHLVIEISVLANSELLPRVIPLISIAMDSCQMISRCHDLINNLLILGAVSEIIKYYIVK